MNKLIVTLLVIFILVVTAGAHSDKLVIDTDAGADDAAAILLILSAWASNDTSYDVIGITCVYGNTYEENVEQNVLKTLTVANLSHIPVYAGAKKPLMDDYIAENWFGVDGLGDFNFEDEIIGEVDRSTHAAVALVNLAKKYPGELNVLVLGPLTNIAIAVSLDPDFPRNVKRFFIMGGSVSSVGNKSPGVEYNFGSDPDSNFIVLNIVKNIPHLLFPWETCLGSNISKSWRVNELGSINSSFIEFLNKAENKIISYGLQAWNPSDAMAAAVMLWPNLVKKSITVNTTPVIDGAARGSLLIDYAELTSKPKNVEIIQEIDVEEFKHILTYYLS
ncbi:uncharacterized protein LOC103571186 isoform X2 [Microplitis demolitor]|uniref:uncharacterized protein LOC103571186 isoform X2 n=1 Tax=Microplitis demolitor TaxID=69319 RepID=UPI0004CDD881|nr:uncharacterized protein LOC103571186 isoform X2 [Microplitis demolitor]